jgi:hypothetical protein
MMPQNVRLLEENVGGVGISPKDTDSSHHKGQKRRGVRAAIFTNGYFSLTYEPFSSKPLFFFETLIFSFEKKGS